MNKRDCYEILLTYKCNARCEFCSQGDFDKSIYANLDQIYKEIYIAKQQGYKKIGFSGGEPTVVKELEKIIKFAKKTGFNFIRIQTNGIRLSDYKFAKRLKDAGLTYCKFSFSTYQPEIHDKLTGIKGSWEKAVKGLENMKKLKVRLGNNILINKFNYNKLDKIVEFFLNKGISNFVIIYPIYTGNMKKNHKKIGIPLYKCSEHFLKATKLMEKHNLSNEILFLNITPCFLKGYENNVIGISAFNTVVKSPEGVKTDLDESANSHKIKNKNICNKCVYYKECPGIDKTYIELFGWKGFKAVKKNNIHKKKNRKTAKNIYFTDNERCLIEILTKHNNISIEQIIKYAKKIPLCQDCTDGNNIINTATKLIEKKLIKLNFKNGKYYLSLK